MGTTARLLKQVKPCRTTLMVLGLWGRIQESRMEVSLFFVLVSELLSLFLGVADGQRAHKALGANKNISHLDPANLGRASAP